jgi:four helix bundle protein
LEIWKSGNVEILKEFAKRVVGLCRQLPKDWDIRELAKQLLRSATSVAANYRACGRARSDKEFCSKLGVVVEEADESQLWIELLKDSHAPLDARTYKAILTEATELTAIFTASHRTARGNLERPRFPHFHISTFPNYPMICAIVSRLILIFIRCRALVM